MVEEQVGIFEFQVLNIVVVGLDDDALLLRKETLVGPDGRVEQSAVYQVLHIQALPDHDDESFVKAVPEVHLISQLEEVVHKGFYAENGVVGKSIVDGVDPIDVVLVHVHHVVHSVK